VAAGEEGDEQPLEHRVLADDDALDLVQRLREGRARVVVRQVVVEAEEGMTRRLARGSSEQDKRLPGADSALTWR
jgi:hypothetical protein